MALERKNIYDRELHKFVESPSRPTEPAVEVVDYNSNNTLTQVLAALQALLMLLGGEPLVDQSANILLNENGDVLVKF